MADEKKDYVGEINKSKDPAVIVLVIIVIATILIIGMISKSCETETINLKQKIIDPKKAVARMEKQLGSRWRKIEMIQGKWYGPYSVRRGTKWEIPTEEVLIKTIDGNGKEKMYEDKPNVHLKLADIVKISFYSRKEKGVVFLKY